MSGSVEVAAGVIFREGLLLITQRHESGHLGGLWEFPGGKCEANETLPQCLQRELLEELGVEVAVGELVESIRHEYPDRKVQVEFFLCKIVSGYPRALDCQDLRWVEAAELTNYEFLPADEQLLQRLRNESKWWLQGGPEN
jgi:mutator protein MutT|tara:strand:- start:3432 stop:3854 length:423 start_codon:yes stop_codon:yes gene_type:complete